LDDAALMLIDVQRGFDHPGWGPPSGRTLSADQLAEATATNLDGEFASVINTRELLGR
jgi:hypothetical protein